MAKKRNIIVFIATSLDGYIATEEDSLEWLFHTEGEGDNGYSEFIAKVDTILMGRRTYDWVMAQEKGVFPYKDQKCYIFSRTHTGEMGNVAFVNPEIPAFVRALKEQEGGAIWLVGGGDLIHSFLKEQLVDEFFITVSPVLLGTGIPLFKKHEGETALQLLGMRRFNQFVELHYKMK